MDCFADLIIVITQDKCIAIIKVFFLHLQQLAIVKFNVGTSDCGSRTFFIMNFLNFLK